MPPPQPLQLTTTASACRRRPCVQTYHPRQGHGAAPVRSWGLCVEGQARSARPHPPQQWTSARAAHAACRTACRCALPPAPPLTVQLWQLYFRRHCWVGGGDVELKVKFVLDEVVNVPAGGGRPPVGGHARPATARAAAGGGAGPALACGAQHASPTTARRDRDCVCCCRGRGLHQASEGIPAWGSIAPHQHLPDQCFPPSLGWMVNQSVSLSLLC
jgi:hypothetical protein